MRNVTRPRTTDRIAAQRNDVADTGLTVGFYDLVDLCLRRRDAGEVSSGIERRLVKDTNQCGVSALAG